MRGRLYFCLKLDRVLWFFRIISVIKWNISTTCAGSIGLLCLSVEYCRFKKNFSYSDLPHRRSDCTGVCWCCAPQPGGEFPRTRERPWLEKSRRGAKFPGRSSGLTIHTFWSCGDTDGKASIMGLSGSYRIPCGLAWLRRPAEAVEQVVSPVVSSLKEAGEIKLGACETFEILLILEEQKICKETEAHKGKFWNTKWTLSTFTIETSLCTSRGLFPSCVVLLCLQIIVYVLAFLK